MWNKIENISIICSQGSSTSDHTRNVSVVYCPPPPPAAAAGGGVGGGGGGVGGGGMPCTLQTG